MITMLDRAITPETEDRSTSPIQVDTPEPDLHAYESCPESDYETESDIDILSRSDDTAVNESNAVESLCDSFTPVYGRFMGLVMNGLQPSNIGDAVSQIRTIIDMAKSMESILLMIDLSQEPDL